VCAGAPSLPQTRQIRLGSANAEVVEGADLPVEVAPGKLIATLAPINPTPPVTSNFAPHAAKSCNSQPAPQTPRSGWRWASSIPSTTIQHCHCASRNDTERLAPTAPG
jgi:hypothetical protein